MSTTVPLLETVLEEVADYRFTGEGMPSFPIASSGKIILNSWP
jgi:hypothetical protein